VLTQRQIPKLKGTQTEDQRDLDGARCFDSERAQNYDCQIRIVVPGYEALHSTACSLLQRKLKEQARLLIVGAGTGKEIIQLGNSNPGWQFTGVDPSPDMITIARRRVIERDLSGRAKLHACLAHDLPVSEPYDAATLMLAMHFVPDDGEKLRLLHSISSRLKPGAPFILADLHGDRMSERFARFIGAWRCRQIALGMTAEEVEGLFQNILSEIQFIPEKRIMALMREAGFEHIEPFYGALLLGGWVARRNNRPSAIRRGRGRAVCSGKAGPAFASQEMPPPPSNSPGEKEMSFSA
jgi:tRNA (cmo5U34)-methyltransferase